MACNSPALVLDKFQRPQFVPCGHCWACKADYIEGWRARLSFEMQGKPAVMVTLTYNDEHLSSDLQIHKEDIQNFNKRLRKYYSDNHFSHKKYKYFISGEYGNPSGGFRPHYHGVFIGLSYADKPLIEKCWANGFVVVKPCNADAVKYILKYVVKQKDKDCEVIKRCEELNYEKPFLLMSKGIGKQFMFDHMTELRKNGGYYDRGKLKPLPRYYRNGLHIVGKRHTTIKQDKQIKDYAKQHNINVVSARYALGRPAEEEAARKVQLFDKGSIL